MKDSKDFYNDSSFDWANDSKNDDIMNDALFDFLSHIQKNSRILDIGCGTGYETAKITKLGYNPVGIDFSEKSIELAKLHCKEAKFFVRDVLCDFDIKEKFDASIIIALIIHFDEKELKKFFDNLYDVLEDKAQILLTFAVGEGMDKDLSYKKYNGVEYFRPFFRYKVEEIMDIIEEKYCFVREIKSDSQNWKNIVLRKV